MRRRHCLSTALLALPGAPRGIGVLRAAAGQEAGDPRFHYAIKLLRLALNKAGVEPTLQLSTDYTQPRQVLELGDGRLDVGLLPASGLPGTERLLPVRVPLRRGLLGLRLLLATAERAPEIAESPSLFELQRRFRLGHGADWGDLALMRRCGFRVVTSNGYAGLFRMLEADRFDFLSRAVSEVWDELASPGLAASWWCRRSPSSTRSTISFGSAQAARNWPNASSRACCARATTAALTRCSAPSTAARSSAPR